MFHCQASFQHDSMFLVYTTGPPGIPLNIRFSNITSTSFVVQWDEVDDADQYDITVKRKGNETATSQTSHTSRTVTGLTPNTIYELTVIATNGCGRSAMSNSTFMVTPNVTTFIRPSVSVMMSSVVDRATTPTGNNITFCFYISCIVHQCYDALNCMHTVMFGASAYC